MNILPDIIKPDVNWVDNERAADRLLDAADGDLRLVEEAYAAFRSHMNEKPSVDQTIQLINGLVHNNCEASKLNNKNDIKRYLKSEQ